MASSSVRPAPPSVRATAPAARSRGSRRGGTRRGPKKKQTRGKRRVRVINSLDQRPRRRSYDKIALYEPETNVEPHAKIDLDQQEINAAVAAVDFAEAIRVYEEGGGGFCTQADVDDEATNQCNAVGCLLYTSPSPRDRG